MIPKGILRAVNDFNDHKQAEIYYDYKKNKVWCKSYKEDDQYINTSHEESVVKLITKDYQIVSEQSLLLAVDNFNKYNKDYDPWVFDFVPWAYIHLNEKDKEKILIGSHEIAIENLLEYSTVFNDLKKFLPRSINVTILEDINDSIIISSALADKLYEGYPSRANEAMKTMLEKSSSVILKLKKDNILKSLTFDFQKELRKAHQKLYKEFDYLFSTDDSF